MSFAMFILCREKIAISKTYCAVKQVVADRIYILIRNRISGIFFVSASFAALHVLFPPTSDFIRNYSSFIFLLSAIWLAYYSNSSNMEEKEETIPFFVIA